MTCLPPPSLPSPVWMVILPSYLLSLHDSPARVPLRPRRPRCLPPHLQILLHLTLFAFVCACVVWAPPVADAVVTSILSYLSPKDLGRVSCADARLRGLAGAPAVWTHLFTLDFQPRPVDLRLLANSPAAPKNMYKSRVIARQGRIDVRFPHPQVPLHSG